MSAERAQAMVTALGERLGIPGLRLGASASCQLVFEQRWVVTLVHDAALGQIVLHCPLCAPAQTGVLSSATLRAMLQANFMGQGCGGGQIGIGPDERACLQMAVALARADEDLPHALEQLLNQAERWARRLQAGDEPGAPADPAALPSWAMQKV